jgi:hypothetical protein
MFRGLKPPGQPRSLRSIAEKNQGANFPPPGPVPEAEWGKQYNDPGMEALPKGFGSQSATAPSPFGK